MFLENTRNLNVTGAWRPPTGCSGSASARHQRVTTGYTGFCVWNVSKVFKGVVLLQIHISRISTEKWRNAWKIPSKLDIFPKLANKDSLRSGRIAVAVDFPVLPACLCGWCWWTGLLCIYEISCCRRPTRLLLPFGGSALLKRQQGPRTLCSRTLALCDRLCG